MKPVLHILALLVAFAGGFLIRGLWKEGEREPSAEVARLAKVQSQVGPPLSSGAVVHDSAQRPEAGSKGNYIQLDRKVADALAVNASPDLKLMRMGLDGEQVKAVHEIQKEGQVALKEIEKAHATPKSDAQGEYVEIRAFPEDREKWLGGMIGKLRDLLGDDRAEVVARIIAYQDNDQEVGLYRREVFVTDGDQEGKARIEERVFDGEGKHIDSDYEVVDANTLGRWGHVLEGGER
ncbi:hypothetical protein [Luteolibacter luteus]|uniref:Uncharacterized protein n=1 Tax=Luteolibacter luteus TaxID=2728835 RepID=A0A858RQS3_9BACT|nr:hypothetical protein [Luteolibacter luteus]QJE98273.1 hypothetical protein HHL09_21640 [Luteolibacter luteus]